MPKGAMFTAADDIRNILTEIVSLLGAEREVKGGWPCVRIARHPPDPPSSPDLAPSDFLLFGHLKNHVQGQQFGFVDDLLSGI
jgi:hypothetical protein